MNYTYEQYNHDLALLEQTLLTEGFVDSLKGVPAKMSAMIKPITEFFPEISIKQIISAFKQTKVFAILKHFGFSLAKIASAINQGISLVDKGILKVFKELGKTDTIKKLKSGVLKIDDIINKYPILNRITGVAVAGILVMIWLNMSFAGNFAEDMDLSPVFKALTGSFSLTDLFASASGAKMLTLLTVGLSSAGLISFPWLMKSSANLAMAISYSAFKLAKTGDINMDEIKRRILRKKLKEGVSIDFKEFINER